MEKPLKTLICTACGISFAFTDVDQHFLDRLAPEIAGEKISLPPPKLCPGCRKIRRHAWRNEKNLFKRKCDATGKTLLSLFSPDAPCPVYASDYWYSDRWDARSYGRDFDFSRSFFEAWSELKEVVPMPGKAISQKMENSEYSDNCSNLKNCYLVFNAANNEDCLYSTDIWGSSHCIDGLSLLECHECYELLNAYNCYNVHSSYDVKNSRDCLFLFHSEGCQDCYGCYGLKNKQYYIYNTPHTEESYRKNLLILRSLPEREQKKRFEEFLKKTNYEIQPPENIGSENVSDSTQVHNSKNISHSFAIRDSEDIRYGRSFYHTKLLMDADQWGDHLERVYESHQIGEHGSSLYFTLCSWNNISSLFYSAYCINNVHHCFGCIGLRNASYCILNRQYTKEEYEALVPRIIRKMIEDGEWGEYIPARYSHFGYNQTMNMDAHPLSKKEALERGFHWSDYETPFPKVEKIIPASRLPDAISDIPDEVLEWAIECEVSKKPFRITKSELLFYRKHSLPLPKRHPDERYRDRRKIYINY